ncbi:hypothetical protein PUN28_008634 [Cardiocondyla obscurior]
MLTFALLSVLLILSGIRTVGNDFNHKSSRSPASAVITKIIYGHTSYVESIFYKDIVQPPQRRLLEHPRRAKQVYRSHDYNIAREYRRPRYKLDESRLYRSAFNNDENEDEEEEEEEEDEEEEENESDEEDKFDDEDADEDADAEQDEEETVAVRNRIARSGYVPLRGELRNDHEKREVVKIRSNMKECKDESIEPSQYYEYETEVRNVASQDARCGECQVIILAKIFTTSLLILLFT